MDGAARKWFTEIRTREPRAPRRPCSRLTSPGAVVASRATQALQRTRSRRAYPTQAEAIPDTMRGSRPPCTRGPANGEGRKGRTTRAGHSP